ncbi:DUF1707 domain-containing protein [Corynebacterium mastitidis]|nr:DUF1707 domain-containing protein [Corynebacterium mastitidis]MCH6197598.1 DUF1707 domain-containing protein [Corynebacterium mastitidis]
MGNNPPSAMPPRHRASDNDRAATHHLLSTALSRGQLSLSEFDARSASAYRATYLDELAPLTQDLPGAAPSPEGGPRRSLAFLSSSRWEHEVLPPRHLSVSFLGTITLDLREAVFSAPRTTLNAQAYLGNITVIVPPHVRVQVDGVGILGNFSRRARRPALDPHGPAHTPLLRITGLSFLGNVTITSG